MLKLIYVITAILLHDAVLTVVAVSDFPVVNSTSGILIGHRAPNRTETFEFLGIKYGQAPIGPLRFAAPRRVDIAPGIVYNASQWNA